MTVNSIKSSKAFSVFKDSAICLVVLTAATLAGYAFKAFQLADADIIMLYIIAVLVISIFTSKMYFCLISSLVGVMLFNCFFTYPEFSLSGSRCRLSCHICDDVYYSVHCRNACQ